MTPAERCAYAAWLAVHTTPAESQALQAQELESRERTSAELPKGECQ